MIDNKTEHSIFYAGLDSHKGEYWYKCSKCGESDWITSYGRRDQLDFYNTNCVNKENKDES